MLKYPSPSVVDSLEFTPFYDATLQARYLDLWLGSTLQGVKSLLHWALPRHVHPSRSPQAHSLDDERG